MFRSIDCKGLQCLGDILAGGRKRRGAGLEGAHVGQDCRGFLAVQFAQHLPQRRMLVGYAVVLVVGLAISLVQALTQVQEMTLTFVPKLGAIVRLGSRIDSTR